MVDLINSWFIPPRQSQQSEELEILIPDGEEILSKEHFDMLMAKDSRTIQ